MGEGSFCVEDGVPPGKHHEDDLVELSMAVMGRDVKTETTMAAVTEAPAALARGFSRGEEQDNDVDLTPRYPPGNSSTGGAVANFVNSIVGAGIVGLPFALAQVCE